MTPQCDGSTRNGTRNCPQHATWQVKAHDGVDWVWGACAQHLSQVGAMLLGGEQGELIVRRIKTDE